MAPPGKIIIEVCYFMLDSPLQIKQYWSWKAHFTSVPVFMLLFLWAIYHNKDYNLSRILAAQLAFQSEFLPSVLLNNLGNLSGRIYFVNSLISQASLSNRLKFSYLSNACLFQSGLSKTCVYYHFSNGATASNVLSGMTFISIIVL